MHHGALPVGTTAFPVHQDSSLLRDHRRPSPAPDTPGGRGEGPALGQRLSLPEHGSSPLRQGWQQAGALCSHPKSTGVRSWPLTAPPPAQETRWSWGPGSATGHPASATSGPQGAETARRRGGPPRSRRLTPRSLHTLCHPRPPDSHPSPGEAAAHCSAGCPLRPPFPETQCQCPAQGSLLPQDGLVSLGGLAQSRNGQRGRPQPPAPRVQHLEPPAAMQVWLGRVCLSLPRSRPALEVKVPPHRAGFKQVAPLPQGSAAGNETLLRVQKSQCQ